MNDLLLLGVVFVVVVVALRLLFRGRRRVQKRCPACLRYGDGENYGRYRCSACGAHFVLNAAGEPARSIWDVVVAPVWVLAISVAALIYYLFRGEFVAVAVLALASLSLFGELRRAFGEKLFGGQGDFASP